MRFGVSARRLTPLLAVRLCQPEAKAAFLNLEALAAQLVVIGHPAQVWMPLGVSGEPTLEPGVVGEDVDGGAGLREVYISVLVILFHKYFSSERGSF